MKVHTRLPTENGTGARDVGPAGLRVALDALVCLVGDAASAAPTAYPEPAVVVPVIAEVAYPEPGLTAPAATLTPTPEPALPTALPTDAPTTEPEQAVEKSQPVAAYLAFAGLAGILGAALLILRRKEKS